MDVYGFNGIIDTGSLAWQALALSRPALRAAVPFDHVSKMPLQASIFACGIIDMGSLAHDI